MLGHRSFSLHVLYCDKLLRSRFSFLYCVSFCTTNSMPSCQYERNICHTKNGLSSQGPSTIQPQRSCHLCVSLSLCLLPGLRAAMDHREHVFSFNTSLSTDAVCHSHTFMLNNGNKCSIPSHSTIGFVEHPST